MPLNRIAQRLFMPLAAGTLAACAIVPKPDNQTRAGFSMERMTVEGCVPATDQPPVLVKAKAPDYPVKRRIVGEEGFTELQYDITITGTVDNVVNLNSSHPAFYARGGAGLAVRAGRQRRQSGARHLQAAAKLHEVATPATPQRPAAHRYGSVQRAPIAQHGDDHDGDGEGRHRQQR